MARAMLIWAEWGAVNQDQEDIQYLYVKKLYVKKVACNNLCQAHLLVRAFGGVCS